MTEDGKVKKVVVSILKIIIFFIGWAVLAGIIEVPIEDPAIWRFFAELIPFLVMVVFTVIFLLIEKKQIKIQFLMHLEIILQKIDLEPFS